MHQPARLDAGLEEKLDLLDQVLNVLRGTGNLDGEQWGICNSHFVVDQVHVGLWVHREIGGELPPIELKGKLGEACVLVPKCSQCDTEIQLDVAVGFAGHGFSPLAFVVGYGVLCLHGREVGDRR